MKRRQFIKSFVLFSTILIGKPSRLFASINSVRLGQKAPVFLLNGFNKNNTNKFKKCLGFANLQAQELTTECQSAIHILEPKNCSKQICSSGDYGGKKKTNGSI